MKATVALVSLLSLTAHAGTTCRNLLGDLHCDDGTMIRKDGFGDIHIEDSYIYRQKTITPPVINTYTPSYSRSNYNGPILSKNETTAFGLIFTLAGALIAFSSSSGEMKVLGASSALFGIVMWNMDTTD
jgi:hypothetical protein